MDNATVVVSGTKIAEEIGTSRSEVWRLVQQLRALGVEIAGHPATGYQLKSVPDLLLPDMLAPALRGTIFGADVHRDFITITRSALPTSKPWRAPARVRRKAAFSWRKNKPPDGARRASMGLGALGRDLLLGGAASGAAAFRGAGAFAGRRDWRCTPRCSRSTPESCPI